LSHKPIKVGVVGVGYLGRFHAQKYAANPRAELVGVVDLDQGRAREVGREVGAPALPNHRRLIGLAQAVSVVTPALTHAAVAGELLEAGLHCLVEKPMTATLQEADGLIKLAGKRGLILQVGFLERFNPAVAALGSLVVEPRYIEARRTAPYLGRGLDVDVVLDLMIHDLDLVLNLVGQEPEVIRSVGAPLLSPGLDMASAWLEFPSGCVASLTATRVSTSPCRRLQISQPDCQLMVDCTERTLTILERAGSGKGADEGREVLPGIVARNMSFPRTDPLAEETDAFLQAVASGTRPRVDGRDGRRALAAALAVADQISRR